MAQPVIKHRKITDYIPDSKNANRGTERGQGLMDKSVEDVGLARSIVAANDDTIPAGNKTLQAAVDAGLEDVLEIETDGKTLVVVKRTDWPTVDSPQARKYAYYDNRVSQVSMNWDADQLAQDVMDGVDLSGLFADEEMQRIINRSADDERRAHEVLDDVPDVGRDLADNARDQAQHDLRFPLAIVLDIQQRKRWEAYKVSIRTAQDTPAFMRLLDEMTLDA